jgi:iron complex outermembrane recepter protein
MKLTHVTISLVAASALYAAPIKLGTVDVTGSSVSSVNNTLLVQDNNSSVSPVTQRFTKKSLESLGSKANMNPYYVMQYAPSVNFSPVDISGSNESSHHAPIRIRGELQTGAGGVYAIDGMPISSNPGGGKQMLDMENVSSVDLYKGYMPVEENIGLATLAGRVDMHVLEPSKTQKTTISQSFGSFNFQRTFVRFDTGKIGDFSFFGSISQMSDKKTKGAGDMHRINGMVGIEYQPSSKFKAQVYAVRNTERQHEYAQLSYLEASNLGKYFSQDFATTQPTTTNDVNYYDWNKESFVTTDLFAIFDYKPTQNDRIVFKPYYKKDVGDYWYSAVKSDPTKNGVIDWELNHDLYGAVASYAHTFSDAFKAKVGYWIHKQLPPGPPTTMLKYQVVNGQLKLMPMHDGYALRANAEYYTLQSPFMQFSGDIGKFHYKAGVSYQSIKIGAIKNYHGQAYDPNASLHAKSFDNVSPSLYLGYDVTKNTTVYADYTRKYGFNVNLFPTYVMNEASFLAKGVTLQSLWDKLKLETSDNIDLGVKTNIGAITLKPNLYASFYKNKQVSIYDSSVGVSYPANVGDALAYGAELSAYGPITENLQFVAGLSYNRYKFTQNFQTSSATTSDIKGNQLPDAPKYMGNAALIYNYDRWSVTPSVRYTSSRYGDVANEQKIDAYTLVNLDVSYKAHPFMGSKSTIFSVTAMNLTNQKYIASVITADNIVAASTTESTYQTGMPFGMFATVKLTY